MKKKMAKQDSPKRPPPQKQVARFLAKYEPAIARQALAAFKKMRARLPGAAELVYDNYNALVSGFGPTERASEAIFSIAVFPRWVTLCFLLNGAKLSDPQKLLRGSGAQVRTMRLPSAAALDEPAVRALMQQALALSPKKIDATAQRRLIIKSVSAKQRPRRPA